jgi:hypothetical protein
LQQIRFTLANKTLAFSRFFVTYFYRLRGISMKMILMVTRPVLALVLIQAICLAKNPEIGLITTNGSFEVDNSRIWGNASLFEGDTLATAHAPSHVKLNNGVQIRLAADSRVKVYQGRTILEKGIAELESFEDYELHASTLRISSAAPKTRVHVRLTGANVIVASVAGTVHVTNAQGVLVASMNPGRELLFDTQVAGGTAETKITGCLVQKTGKFTIMDQTTNIIMEVEGDGLASEVGNQVEVTGTSNAQVLRLKNLKHIATGGCANIPKAGAAAAVASHKTAVVAIIGGVAAAATVVGLGASGSFSGREVPISTSR